MRKELQASTTKTETTKNGLSITATREGRLPNDKHFYRNELNRNTKRQPSPANSNQELKMIWLQGNSLTGDICKGIVGDNLMSATADYAAAAFGSDLITKARSSTSRVQCEYCTECCDLACVLLQIHSTVPTKKVGPSLLY